MVYGLLASSSIVGTHFTQAIPHPVRVHQIPRQIPPAPKYLRPWAAALLSGILPFGTCRTPHPTVPCSRLAPGAAFVELYFVLSSLFASRAYYAFGFLALTAGIVGLTTATVTILFTYFILCAEEYRWQWRAFLTGGGSAFWLLAYGLFFWASRLSLDSLSSAILYLGYLLLLVIFDFLITGASPLVLVLILNNLARRDDRLPGVILGRAAAVHRHPHRLVTGQTLVYIFE